jgi:hypothetical protein
MSMILKHILGQSIGLAEPARELPLWRYGYGGEPKPFLHPVCTPAGHYFNAAFCSTSR